MIISIIFFLCLCRLVAGESSLIENHLKQLDRLTQCQKVILDNHTKLRSPKRPKLSAKDKKDLDQFWCNLSRKRPRANTSNGSFAEFSQKPRW